ncbi:vesicle transport protein SEC20 [Condylostylus longicornis]|uniref:vesicle transport protein SEC20 n=1 Tax=Condylostylus longicornis TaxID=2530218 RepID=UPI00244E132B|nr:vesicle transport protein SEC20 [Condylostylus longicornis]
MNGQNFTLSSIKQDIIDSNLNAKAIIQDINSFRGTLPELEALNEAGRLKLSALRKCIERLDDVSKDEGSAELSKEVDLHREQFSKTLQAFRKANVAAMMEIKKASREELFSLTGNSELRQRTEMGTGSQHNRLGLVAQQDNVTEKMLSITRHLSETTQKSAATLDTLVLSSQTVEGTRSELHSTAGAISKSGKLLKKYGRRECTDKILLLFAFIFFLFVVFYIMQKRLF